MAVYSMTGYASAASEPGSTAAAVTVEARSVNGRFLDLALRLPDEVRGLEPALRELLTAGFRRGKIELRVATARDADAALPLAAFVLDWGDGKAAFDPLAAADRVVHRRADREAARRLAIDRDQRQADAIAALTLGEDGRRQLELRMPRGTDWMPSSPPVKGACRQKKKIICDSASVVIEK